MIEILINSGRRPVQKTMSGIDQKYRTNGFAIKQEDRLLTDSFVPVSSGISIIST